ncbi:hypothetical protein M413DRAFT_448302 [Hebeloma cylindrosporum]|uniref:Uncharacterized protein n=1 Tax=Hebeloma cylindrosporum TaxID=76867 RepID=A0A0C2Y9U2_HEBCY|nr:hypothetical protein M413DRAFT_448302 [Hebeloma cylindrosporum h7]
MWCFGYCLHKVQGSSQIPSLMSFLHSVYTRAFRISLNQRNGNGLLGRGVGAVVAPRRWFSASKRSALFFVKTLNSERMEQKGQRVLDISDRVSVRLYLDDLRPRILYTRHMRFPAGTNGLFYYHQPPALPPIAGEVRFRLCDDPSQFAHGKDLEIESGIPWTIPLINIVRVVNYKGIRDLLLEERFVDRELVADIENMTGIGAGGQRRGITLCDIDQPFTVKLDRKHFDVHLTTRSCVRMVSFSPFSTGGEMYTPFSGRIKARFEIHSQESDSTEALRLRVLETLTPITRNPLPVHLSPRVTVDEPRPGELLLRRKFRGFAEPWDSPLSRTSQNVETVKAFLAERALEKKKYGV